MFDFLLQELLDSARTNLEAGEALHVVIGASPEGFHLISIANNRKRRTFHLIKTSLRPYEDVSADTQFRYFCCNIEVNRQTTPRKSEVSNKLLLTI